MLKTLHIFDLLPFMHAGHINKHSRLEQLIDVGSTWKTQVTPTGGVSLLLNSLYPAVMEGDVIVASDRTPTIKKEMYPPYKCNREHKSDITLERMAAEYILQKCNVSTVARVGYEADDIIYTYVKHFHDQYDKIYIYTGDSDLYFLVDDVVEIRPSNSRAKTVTRENYEKVAYKAGMKYNCITVYKMLTGDSSDGIAALSSAEQDQLIEALYREGFYEHLGDKDFVKYWVNTLCPQFNDRVDLLFPLELEDIPFDIKTPDKQMLVNFGDSINNKNFRGRAAVDFDVTPYVAEMQNNGIYLEEDN